MLILIEFFTVIFGVLGRPADLSLVVWRLQGLFSVEICDFCG